MIIRKSGYRQTDNVFVAVRFFLKFDSLGKKNRVGNINYNKDETLTLAVDTQFSIQNTQTTDHKGKLYCLEKKVVPTFHFKNHKKKNQINVIGYTCKQDRTMGYFRPEVLCWRMPAGNRPGSGMQGYEAHPWKHLLQHCVFFLNMIKKYWRFPLSASFNTECFFY